MPYATLEPETPSYATLEPEEKPKSVVVSDDEVDSLFKAGEEDQAAREQMGQNTGLTASIPDMGRKALSAVTGAGKRLADAVNLPQQAQRAFAPGLNTQEPLLKWTATPGAEYAAKHPITAGIIKWAQQASEAMSTPDVLEKLAVAPIPGVGEVVGADFLANMAVNAPEEAAAFGQKLGQGDIPGAIAHLGNYAAAVVGPAVLLKASSKTAATPLEKPSTEGEPNASRQQQAAEVHGDLRPQPVESERQVPVAQSVGGVQPQIRSREESLGPQSPAPPESEITPAVPVASLEAKPAPEPAGAVAEKDQMFSAAENLLGGKLTRSNPDPLVNSLESKAIEKYAWNAQKPNQVIGNRQIIVPVDEEIWTDHVKKLTRDKGTLTDHEKKYGKLYASFIQRENDKDWVLGKVGDLETARGTPKNTTWQKKVSSFDSPESQTQRARGDEEPAPEPAKAVEPAIGPGPGAATRGAEDIGARESNIAPLEHLADAVSRFPEQKGSFKEKLGQWMDSIGVPVKDFFTRSYIAAKAVPAWIKEKATTLPEVTDLDRRVGIWNGDEWVGGQAARSFSANVKKTFGDRSKLRALSNWIDAEGNKELLLQRAAATKNPILRKSYEDAAKFGEDESRLANEVKNYHEDMLAWGQREGVLEDGLEKYLHRYYRESDPVLQKKLEALRYLKFSKDFAGFKKRFYDTDFDAEQAGLTPEKDAAKRILSYDYGFRQALTAREFVKRSFDAEKAVAKDGRPELDVAGGGTKIEGDNSMTLVKPKFRADSGKPEDYRGDYVRFDHPAFQRYKFATTDSAGKPILVQGDILVHPDFAKKYAALFEKSWWGKGPIRRAIIGTSGFVKQTMLQGPFHLVQITLGGVEHRINPFKLMDLVPNDPAQRRMAEAGLFEGDQGMSYATEGVSGGGLLDKLPVAGEYLQASKDWLFKNYIPRWKMTLALEIEKRGMENYAADIKAGRITPEQITRMAARQSAAVFGGQNQRAIFRSRTFQDTLRALFLAPDFGEERLRQVLQAFGKYGKEQRTALLLGAVGLAVVAKSVEKALTGEMRFDRPFTVTHKGKEYGLRTPAADIAHFVTDPLGYVRNRLNPILTRPLLEGLTGRDYFGRKRSPWEQVKDEANTVVPIPLRGAVTKSQHLWESFLNSTGITEHRDSDSEAIYKLADQWKTKNKIVPKPDEEIYNPDKDIYRDIRQAAREDDVKQTKKEIDALAAKGLKTEAGKPVTAASIKAHFARTSTSSWTGSKSNDAEFKNSLSDADKKRLENAAKERLETSRVVQSAR